MDSFDITPDQIRAASYADPGTLSTVFVDKMVDKVPSALDPLSRTITPARGDRGTGTSGAEGGRGPDHTGLEAGPAWKWRADPSNPYIPTPMRIHRHGTSQSPEDDKNVERRPVGRECVYCGKSKCPGHPK